MVDQDAGAAIKGPGRVDIFWGTGKEAGDIAGSIKEKGKLFYLLIKEDGKAKSKGKGPESEEKGTRNKERGVRN
jgi:hypothetical protein